MNSVLDDDTKKALDKRLEFLIHQDCEYNRYRTAWNLIQAIIEHLAKAF